MGWPTRSRMGLGHPPEVAGAIEHQRPPARLHRRAGRGAGIDHRQHLQRGGGIRRGLEGARHGASETSFSFLRADPPARRALTPRGSAEPARGRAQAARGWSVMALVPHLTAPSVPLCTGADADDLLRAPSPAWANHGAACCRRPLCRMRHGRRASSAPCGARRFAPVETAARTLPLMPTPMKTVLLTGATGFVGRAIHRALHGAGFTVRAVVRSGSADRLAAPAASRIETADLFAQDAAWWQEACAGVDTVIHAAWYVTPGRYLTAPENLDCLAGSLALARGAAGGRRRPCDRRRHLL